MPGHQEPSSLVAIDRERGPDGSVQPDGVSPASTVGCDDDRSAGGVGNCTPSLSRETWQVTEADDYSIVTLAAAPIESDP